MLLCNISTFFSQTRRRIIHYYIKKRSRERSKVDQHKAETPVYGGQKRKYRKGAMILEEKQRYFAQRTKQLWPNLPELCCPSQAPQLGFFLDGMDDPPGTRR